MPHVITQSCCSDGSCVYACPVNCIHPSPDEPGFATAEMLYIDPGGLRRLRRLRERLPGRRDRARHASWSPTSCRSSRSTRRSIRNGPRAKLPPTSKLAPVIDAPKVNAREADR